MQAPSLLHAFTITADVDAPVEVGHSPVGERRLIPIGSGTVSGPKLNGRVIPGGVDYQLIRDAGLAEIHARYIIETEAGLRVYVENTGIRRGPPEVIARLRRGETVDQDLIYFRTIPRFETAAPELAWMMRSLFVCAGRRLPSQVILDFYELG